MTRRALLFLVVLAASAHVGSPDTWFRGLAGPYQTLVHIEAPLAIPGLAVVNVEAADPGVRRVTVMAARSDGGSDASPASDALPVPEESGSYHASVRIGAPGSYHVTVTIEGESGVGTAVIPFTVTGLEQNRLAGQLGLILGGAAYFLFLGWLVAVAVAVKEGVLARKPDGNDARARVTRRVAMVSTFVLVLAGVGGWRFWQSERARLAEAVLEPLSAAATVEGGLLELIVQDSAWVMRHDPEWLRSRSAVRRADLVEDHGKLVHLFLIDESGSRAFAHLHPATTDSVRFTVPLPPLPAGRYSVFADVVRVDGLSETLVAAVELQDPTEAELAGGERETDLGPGVAAMSSSDPEDAWVVRGDGSGGGGVPPERAALPTTQLAPARAALSATQLARLPDESSLRWDLEGPLVAGADRQELPLSFSFLPPEGEPPALEPYMAMTAHAVVVRSDGGVFVHLHPLGTVSLAAVAPAAGEHAMHGASSEEITFPYAFSAPGRYTVWVQVKRRGRVLTGAFDVEVAAPDSSGG